MAGRRRQFKSGILIVIAVMKLKGCTKYIPNQVMDKYITESGGSGHVMDLDLA